MELLSKEEEYYRQKRIERSINTNRARIASKALALASKAQSETDPVKLGKLSCAIALLAVAGSFQESRHTDRLVKYAGAVSNTGGGSDD